MGGRDTGRPGDDMATAAEGIAAVRSPSDPSSSPPSSSGPPDSQMTQALFGSDSPTMVEGAPLSPPMRSSAFGSGFGGQSLLTPGAVLGQRYEILQVLGQGGMGAVYKALDREVNRTVALKVIRPDLAGNSSIIDRFKQELVLSHQVTHKNVVRIYDIGEADSVKFITMEYIEGKDLRTLILEKQKFPQDEAVETMVQICRALEATHAVGVIHRDLKPQNIMRDNQGRVVVMDFGLARSIESTDGMTQTGAVVGTMEYMSPEQGLGKQLDERSDLYAAGLIFYELLTGKMPYKADSALASLLKRTQERAAPVSQHDSSIPRSLSNMVAKCLEPKVEHRYQRVSEILAELEAWQGKGAAATLGFEASVGPWGRTIPWPAIGIGVAVIVLAVTGFLLRDKLFHSEKAVTGPQVSLAILPLRNASGDPSLDWLGSSIAEMLTTDVGQSAQLDVVSSDRMHQLLRDLKISAETTLDDSTVQRLAQFSNANQMVWGQYVKFGDQIRLDVTLQNLKEQRSISLKEASSQQDLLAAVDRLAQGIRSNLAMSDSLVQELKTQAFKPSTKSLEAIRSYNEGLELARDGRNLDAIGKFDAATKQDPEFALAYSKLGETYAKLGYGDKADDASRKAVELAQQLPAQERYRILASQALVSNDNQKAIEYYENLAKAAPGDSSIQLALAQLHKNSGHYDAARDYLIKVLDREPNHAEALVAIAEVEGERRNPQGALEYLNRALTLAIQLDNDELRSRVMYATGHIYRLLNKPEEALRNYQDSLAIRRRLGQKAGIAQTLAEIGEVQYAQGKPDEAVASYKEAIQLQREIGDKTYLSHSLLNLGGIYSDRGQYDNALTNLKESLQMQRDRHDENYEAMCLSNIGTVYFLTGRYDDALTYYQQSLLLLQKLKVTGEVPTVLYNLGDTSSRMGQYDQAIAYYLQGLELARTAGNKQLVAFGSYSMGTIFKYQGRYGAAATSQEEALKVYRELNERSSSMAEVLNGYGQTLVLVGRSEEANKVLEEALNLAREIKDDANVSQALNYQGERFLFVADVKSAKPLFEQALQTATRNKNREQILRVRINLAELAAKESGGRNLSIELTRLGQEADSLGLKYLSAQCLVSRAQAFLSAKDYRAAQADVDRALKVSEKSGFKFLQARLHYLQGQVLRATGKPSEAESQQNQALRILQDIGQESHSDSFLKRADVSAMLSARTN